MAKKTLGHRYQMRDERAAHARTVGVELQEAAAISITAESLTRDEHYTRLRAILEVLPEEKRGRYVRMIAWLDQNPGRCLRHDFVLAIFRMESVIAKGLHLVPTPPEALQMIKTRIVLASHRAEERRAVKDATFAAAFKQKGEPPPVPPSRRKPLDLDE